MIKTWEGDVKDFDLHPEAELSFTTRERRLLRPAAPGRVIMDYFSGYGLPVSSTWISLMLELASLNDLIRVM
jgi:hypothetical protein